MPYIKPYVNFKIVNSFVDTSAHIKLSKADKLNIQITADTNVKDLLINTLDNQKLLSWKYFQAKQVNYIFNPMQLSVKSLKLQSPFAKIHINKQGQSNLQNLVKKTNSSAKQTSNKKWPIKIKIGPMKLVDGTSEFSDFSLPFPFKTRMHDLNGDVSTLDFSTTLPSKLNLAGEIDKYGYTHITGKLFPLNFKKNTEFAVLFKNINLNSLTPYSGKFVGYKIKKGKLSMDLNYAIKNSKLVGDNKLNIDTLELGSTVKSKDAVSLPLSLAIALLKDSNDQIDINMPVGGDINNPDFSYGSVVWSAFGNLITGIVTAPFKFLGSMLGIDGEELKAIDFDKGQASLIATEHEKLKNIQTILEKRPGLTLSISGGYSSNYDKKALQKDKLNILIKKELKKDDNYEQVLKELYVKNFSEKRYEQKKQSLLVDANNKPIKLDIVAFNALLKNDLNSKMEVLPIELISLANKRAKLIKDTLVMQYKINTKRVVIKKAKNAEVKQERWIKSALEIGITK